MYLLRFVSRINAVVIIDLKFPCDAVLHTESLSNSMCHSQHATICFRYIQFVNSFHH